MKRSSFFSFLCAFVPGAGEMYMGLMNRGLSIMIVFWAVIGFCTISGLEFFLFLCPVIWFYSFFETLNLRKMTYEQLSAIPDDMVFGLDGVTYSQVRRLAQKRHLLAGGLCIAIGLYMLYDSILMRYWGDFLWDRFPFIYQMLRSLPTLLVAFAIIFLGLHLLRGKAPASADDDFTEYRGADALPADSLDPQEEDDHES